MEKPLLLLSWSRGRNVWALREGGEAEEHRGSGIQCWHHPRRRRRKGNRSQRVPGPQTLAHHFWVSVSSLGDLGSLCQRSWGESEEQRVSPSLHQNHTVGRWPWSVRVLAVLPVLLRGKVACMLTRLGIFSSSQCGLLSVSPLPGPLGAPHQLPPRCMLT